ncbi:MAG: hypothetical protein JNK10_00195 [Cyclobacteriaceae bacterium]|nr:hypothetical protein [Cyclobacteriaceae bacterium]
MSTGIILVLLVWIFTPAYSADVSSLAYRQGKQATEQFVLQLDVVKSGSTDPTGKQVQVFFKGTEFFVLVQTISDVAVRQHQASAFERNPFYAHTTINAP